MFVTEYQETKHKNLNVENNLLIFKKLPMQKELKTFQEEGEVLPDLPKEITSDEQEAKAAAYLKEVMLKVKVIEGKRKLFTKDLVSQKKIIDGEFNGVALPFKHTVTTVKSLLSTYHLKKMREAEKAAKIEAKKPAKDKTKELVEAPKTKVDNVSYKKTWKYEVTDIKKVQRQYLKDDSDVINEAISSGSRKIPGLRIYEDVSVIGRT